MTALKKETESLRQEYVKLQQMNTTVNTTLVGLESPTKVERLRLELKDSGIEHAQKAQVRSLAFCDESFSLLM